MTSKFHIAAGVAALALSAAMGVSQADAAGVKVGVLNCNVASGFGYILGSSKSVNCTYVPNTAGRRAEHYTGDISKVGVDIGFTKGGVLVWGVIAPSSDMKPGALEGGYGGATASATVGVGLGANVLVGGFDKSIALQPISIEGNTGLNIAAGIEGLSLKFAKD